MYEVLLSELEMNLLALSYSPMFGLTLLLRCLILPHSVQGNPSTISTLFTKLRDPISRKSVCFSDKPKVTLSFKYINSVKHCAILCMHLSATRPCASLNYRPQRHSCDLFDYVPVSYSESEDCLHYQVSLIVFILRVFAIRLIHVKMVHFVIV